MKEGSFSPSRVPSTKSPTKCACKHTNCKAETPPPPPAQPYQGWKEEAGWIKQINKKKKSPGLARRRGLKKRKERKVRGHRGAGKAKDGEWIGVCRRERGLKLGLRLRTRQRGPGPSAPRGHDWVVVFFFGGGTPDRQTDRQTSFSPPPSSGLPAKDTA